MNRESDFIANVLHTKSLINVQSRTVVQLNSKTHVPLLPASQFNSLLSKKMLFESES